ncbi:hypothetical protein SG34_005085 [Thalassomonas viridans]|uniref:Uncharacterized protein n=1 Tax=Thalassomonas viridans TaxID=137584 RepID=A0AAF0CAA3_9GAMM|nr:hypothetical protein [Thalassomonas viridans]WDE06301.1 hypothetical protein SG34_005085 [Thalassomonas viridans]
MNILKQSDEEILKIANPILDTILQGINEKNWQLFSTHFAESMKTDEARKNITEQWANPELPQQFSLEREFLAVLRQKDCVLVLWKNQSNDIEGECLEMLYLQSQGEEVKVIGTWTR